ncbi:hypothetical protein CN978_30485 [Priestia megaterium]|uniref:hypothetical protein n=1 Tax=Priestia megaterium TaxID=1404 RepID=UPI000BFBC9B4|nr:hypothetical protein [Priestia megaterium]PGN53612.1 hypothetical protein CN978_30485 [Priestia megaterium]PGQ87665.1 hypothetical protein COA18_07495 [Priestia megaterium]
MNQPSNKLEIETMSTRLISKGNKRKITFRKRMVFLSLSCLIFISVMAIFYNLYNLYSQASPQTSLIIMHFSIIVILFFLWVIMILRQNRIKADNHYYQYLFMVITTIVGFTFSTSFQEWLKENEEKQELLSTLELAIKFYDSLLTDIPPINLSVNEAFSTPEEYRDYLAMESDELTVNREVIFSMTDNNPQKFKDFSPEFRVFLGSSVPLTTLYERLKNEVSLGVGLGDRIQDYYDKYHYLITEVHYRRDMLQTEMDRLNGTLNEKQFKTRVKNIEITRTDSLP